MPQPNLLWIFILFALAAGGWLFWPERGLVWRWFNRRGRAERILAEDALKYLYTCEQRERLSSLESIAGMLSISLDRAAEIMDRARRGGLVVLEGGQFRLTESGKKMALQIIRAHRLWERYLADTTGFSEEEWHQQADVLEHHLSVDETDRLSARLGRPTHDPHGDPIPSRDGVLVDHGGQPLTDFTEGDVVRLVHIEDEPEMVYAQIVAEGLHPHMILRVGEMSSRRVQLWGEEGEYLLAPVFAANLSVLPVGDSEWTQEQKGMTMDRLQVGQSGQILDISPRIRGLDRRRLLDLGVLTGTVVTVEMISPGGDPTAYRIRDSLIALRRDQTRYIRVMPENAREG